MLCESSGISLQQEATKPKIISFVWFSLDRFNILLCYKCSLSLLFAVKNKNIDLLGHDYGQILMNHIEYRFVFVIDSSNTKSLISVSALKHWKSTLTDKNSLCK